LRPSQAWLIIGDRMRELREACDTSLTVSSELSGWSKSHLSRVERGHTKPSLELVQWYDKNFDAHEGLVHQFSDLEHSVAKERAIKRRDDRAHRGRAVTFLPASSTGDERNAVRNWPVPIDHNKQDRPLLISETVPDGTIVSAGHSFEKSWTLRNAGPVAWQARWLTRQGNAGVAGWLRSPKHVHVMNTLPGEIVTITILIGAPLLPSSSSAYFTITDEIGRPYFPDLYPLHCTVVVLDELEHPEVMLFATTGQAYSQRPA
jgi:transcriptional regulator with XRE-family HTH domain